MSEKGYVLITGADSGIGREFALQYSTLGYKLILTSLDLDKLAEVQKEVKTEAVILAYDLSDTKNCYDLIEKVKDYPIDIFVNNAGFGDFGLIDETSTPKALKMIDVNCKASLVLCKEFIKRFKKENRGQHVLATVSAAAFAPAPYMAEYYASKAYLFRLLLGYRQELIDSKSNVKISMLCPGPVKTNFEKTANVKFTIKSLTAQKVVAYAIKKTAKGKTVIVPGFSMKVAHFFSRFANEKLACKILDKSAKNPDHIK